jgi:endonuclease VIII
MEGPSLYLAQAQLKPFKKKVVLEVGGNTKIEKERMYRKEVKDIFAWGKHLVFQFDTFALRTHFLLFGTFEAVVNGVAVTGDYRRARVPRLSLRFKKGEILIFNGSVKFIEEKNAKKTYDFSIDIMSSKWDPTQAYQNVRKERDEEIADVLLDQSIFAGVGNIIKNEVLSNIKINPETKVKDIPPRKLKSLIEEARRFSLQFLRWRKAFKLRAHLKTHRKGICQHCGGKLTRGKTGKRNRWSYYCPVCQAVV